MLLQMVRFHSFLWPSNIPLYICTTAFLIHWPIDRQLCCFHTLAIVNNAAMTIQGHVFFQITVLGFFGYISRSGIAAQKAVPFLIF